MRASRWPYAEFIGEEITSRTEALLGDNVFAKIAIAIFLFGEER